MSAPDPAGSREGPAGSQEPIPTSQERAERLKKELIDRFGEARGNDLFRKAQASTISRLGQDSSITVFNATDIPDVLPRIWSEGIAGLSAAELLSIDAFLTDSHLRHRRMLRLLKYYLQPTEYAAVETSFQLVRRIQDRTTDLGNRSKTMRSLYDRLGRLRYGNRIYNQVSVGWLEELTFPQMRDLELRLSPAGRAHGSAKEQIAQVFYRALEPDATKLWVRSSDDPTQLFGEIAERFGVHGVERSGVPYLDIYAVGQAGVILEAAIADFLSGYLQYEAERHDSADRIGAGYVRLKRRARL
jgi:hypothetical protein